MAMLQIGAVRFQTTSLHYEKLKHQVKFQWVAQKRFGRRDARQYTGIDEEDVQVSGTIYTDYYGGFGSLSRLRAMGARPQMMVSGAGDVFGLWCILSVSNEQTLQDVRGVPRKVTFDLSLGRYGEDGIGVGGGIIGLSVGGTLSVALGQASIGVDAGIGAGGVSVGANISAEIPLF